MNPLCVHPDFTTKTRPTIITCMASANIITHPLSRIQTPDKTVRGNGSYRLQPAFAPDNPTCIRFSTARPELQLVSHSDQARLCTLAVGCKLFDRSSPHWQDCCRPLMGVMCLVATLGLMMWCAVIHVTLCTHNLSHQQLSTQHDAQSPYGPESRQSSIY